VKTPRLIRNLASGGSLALAASALILLSVGGASRAQETDTAAAARAFLQRNAAGLGMPANLHDLRLYGTQEGLTGRHARYQQTLGGVPVFGAYVTVNLPGRGNPTVTGRYVSGLKVPPAKVSISPQTAVTAAAAAGGEASVGGFVYYPRAKDDFRLAWQVTVRTTAPAGEWLTLVDAETGEVLFRTNLLAMDSGQVFNPNPAATNSGLPPAPNCDSPTNQSKLATQYQTVTLQGIEPGQGKLTGEFVDLTAPGIDDGYKSAGMAESPTHEYAFPCNDDRFEEVMTYYHVDTTQRKLQSLGFTGASGLIARPIPVHAHYMTDCNAFYSPVDKGLHFGDSADPLACGTIKVDTAEDADVIIHEYGHALQDELVPGWGFGPYPEAEQARSMGEGFGDFLAAIMSGDPCSAEYANFNEYECGGKPGLRWLQVDNVYPEDFESCTDVDHNGDGFPESEEEHCGGQIWGAALWDLTENLGGGTVTQEARDTALRLVVEAHFYLDPLSTFGEAASAICMVDGLMYGGAHADAIASAFSGRGISSGTCISDDYEYVFIHIRHTWSGDMDVNLLVGPDPGSPLCSINVGDPLPTLLAPDWYITTVVTDYWGCGDFMPPTLQRPWRLEVQDTKSANTGSITTFEVMLRGGSRCVAPGMPLAVPDNGPAVYAVVDCSNQTGPQGPTPLLFTPTPKPSPSGDIDCNGSVNAVDSLMLLRFVAGLSVTQYDPCPAIGGPGVEAGVFGDVDCTGIINSVDSLQILRFTAGLPVSTPDGCPYIGPTTPTPRPTPTPVPTPPGQTPSPAPALVTIRNSESHIDSSGVFVAAGEVVNQSDRPIGLVRVEASLFSASGELLKTGVGYSCLTTLPAGGDSPFEILVFEPGAVDHVTLEVTQFVDPPFIPAPAGLQPQITNTYIDQIGYFHAAGNVVNNSGQGYKLVKACVAFYDSQGAVFRSKFSFTTPNVLDPGQAGAFDTSIKTDGATIASQRVWADGMSQ